MIRRFRVRRWHRDQLLVLGLLVHDRARFDVSTIGRTLGIGIYRAHDAAQALVRDGHATAAYPYGVIPHYSATPTEGTH